MRDSSLPERGKQVWIAASSHKDPLPRGEAGWKSGGTAYLPDVRQRLPDRLYATWRSGGVSRGHYPIELPAQIPAHVLWIGARPRVIIATR